MANGGFPCEFTFGTSRRSELADHVAVGLAAEVLVGRGVDVLSNESDRTVTHQEVCTTFVNTAEAIRTIDGRGCEKVGEIQRCGLV